MLSAQNLYKQQHGEPEIQEKIFKALKEKLDLTFIGCFQYQFSPELKLLQAECYDRTVEKSGAISLNPYSIYEISEGVLYITELVRSDFKGGNFEKNAETILMLNEKLSVIQSKWGNFYSLLSENAPELLQQLPIGQTHFFCQGRSEKEIQELTQRNLRCRQIDTNHIHSWNEKSFYAIHIIIQHGNIIKPLLQNELFTSN
ncbi:Hypothetical_protein [Hexamita inflata]|uniref:Hypothetical_protein n=1 Tax=Hexamita inflata TaxID=28002 RepID=A0AA86NYA7_9EUKA|nr:Hypothetical protein HINF_LOCUS15636 [Hexamita inflata]